MGKSLREFYSTLEDPEQPAEESSESAEPAAEPEQAAEPSAEVAAEPEPASEPAAADPYDSSQAEPAAGDAYDSGQGEPAVVDPNDSSEADPAVVDPYDAGQAEPAAADEYDSSAAEADGSAETSDAYEPSFAQNVSQNQSVDPGFSSDPSASDPSAANQTPDPRNQSVNPSSVDPSEPNQTVDPRNRSVDPNAVDPNVPNQTVDPRAGKPRQPQPAPPPPPPAPPKLSDTRAAYQEGFDVGSKGGMPQCKENVTPEYEQAYESGYRAGKAERDKVPEDQSVRPSRPGEEIVGRIITTFVDGDPPGTKQQYYTGNKEMLDRIEQEEYQKINKATMKGFQKALGGMDQRVPHGNTTEPRLPGGGGAQRPQ